MKKIVFLMIMIMAGWLTATADDYQYPYLVFQATDGTTTEVAVSSLTMTVSNGKLVLTNSDGSQQLTLSDLAKMYFKTSSTGIEQTAAQTDEPVEAFSVAGISVGTFDNVAKARVALKSGIYVLKSKSRTIKVVVK